MSDLKLWIRDNTDGTVRQYGTNPHDSLQVRDGVLEYYNLQNGDGTPTGYSFCNEDGTTHWLSDGPEYDEKYVHIGLINQNPDNAAERALKYFKREIFLLRSAPNVNGCAMTDEWWEQLEYCELAVKAIEKWRNET